MAKEVFVDQDECTGCELCVDSLPDVFRMNDAGLSEVHNSSGAGEDKIQDMIEDCPAECINWK